MHRRILADLANAHRLNGDMAAALSTVEQAIKGSGRTTCAGFRSFGSRIWERWSRTLHGLCYSSDVITNPKIVPLLYELCTC